MEQLLQDGWEPLGRGDAWYSSRFARPLLVILPADVEAHQRS